jgi:menaquinone-dependent protoporphyrinogen oxidase
VPVQQRAAGHRGRGRQGDLRSAAEPREIPGFTKAICPRGHHVFFGALDSRGLTVAERSAGKLPGGAAGLPERGFRDWAEIKDWADGIARDLSAA